MRTYEEVKGNIIKNERRTIQYQNSRLNDAEASDFDKEIATSVIKECQLYIDNVDEVTIIDIGADVNSLVKAIQQYYGLHISEYYGNFEYFMRSYIMGLASPEPRDGYLALAGESECLDLGISFEDLKIFEGKSPFDDEVVNAFIEHVNRNFNTEVPRIGVYEEARKRYNDVAFSEDERTRAEALIALREVQKNGGYLRTGGEYYIEAKDEDLKDAKAICEGVTRN